MHLARYAPYYFYFPLFSKLICLKSVTVFRLRMALPKSFYIWVQFMEAKPTEELHTFNNSRHPADEQLRQQIFAVTTICRLSPSNYHPLPSRLTYQLAEVSFQYGFVNKLFLMKYYTNVSDANDSVLPKNHDEKKPLFIR